MLVWDLGGWGGEGFSLRRPGPGRRGMGCGDLVESFWPLKASTFQDTPGSGMGGRGTTLTHRTHTWLPLVLWEGQLFPPTRLRGSSKSPAVTTPASSHCPFYLVFLPVCSPFLSKDSLPLIKCLSGISDISDEGLALQTTAIFLLCTCPREQKNKLGLCFWKIDVCGAMRRTEVIFVTPKKNSTNE